MIWGVRYARVLSSRVIGRRYWGETATVHLLRENRGVMRFAEAGGTAASGSVGAGFFQIAAQCGRPIATTLKTYCRRKKISIAEGIEQTFITASYKLIKTPCAFYLVCESRVSVHCTREVADHREKYPAIRKGMAVAQD
jgi:hypothetical protein